MSAKRRHKAHLYGTKGASDLHGAQHSVAGKLVAREKIRPQAARQSTEMHAHTLVRPCIPPHPLEVHHRVAKHRHMLTHSLAKIIARQLHLHKPAIASTPTISIPSPFANPTSAPVCENICVTSFQSKWLTSYTPFSYAYVVPSSR